MLRKIKEKFNLYVYILLPLIVSAFYKISSMIIGKSLLLNSTFLKNSIEISLAILATLLTILGLFAALPSSKYDAAMKKYKYHKIVINTLLIGIIATVFHLVLSLIEAGEVIQIYLFLTYLSETVIATIWIYKLLRLIYSD